MGKPEKLGSSKISKTARASTGSRGTAGRTRECPAHPGRCLKPVILVRHTGRPCAGWACESAPTHYYTNSMEEWNP